jgi:hypothetical protein
VSALRAVLRGLAAGAAGTTALNTTTYVDMALRARPASNTPETTVERLSELTHVPVPGSEDERANRLSALGPLTGTLSGLAVGALYATVRALGWRPGSVVGTAATTVAVLVASNGPLAGLGVSDPRTWSTTEWVSDVVPHLAYAAVTVATYEAMAAGRR